MAIRTSSEPYSSLHPFFLATGGLTPFPAGVVKKETGFRLGDILQKEIALTEGILVPGFEGSAVKQGGG